MSDRFLLVLQLSLEGYDTNYLFQYCRDLWYLWWYGYTVKLRWWNAAIKTSVCKIQGLYLKNVIYIYILPCLFYFNFFSLCTSPACWVYLLILPLTFHISACCRHIRSPTLPEATSSVGLFILTYACSHSRAKHPPKSWTKIGTDLKTCFVFTLFKTMFHSFSGLKSIITSCRTQHTEKNWYSHHGKGWPCS